ncbi:S28 family serine protease [Streptomyces sp. TR06-5]|uniref:S28 family serine protease n=1 Tax=unclassified Streptomyces TaxID=2593676 RepID=UPI0039A1695D
MRRALGWLLSLVVLVGTVGAGAGTATADPAAADIEERLLAIPGMSLIEEKPVDGYRFFLLNYEQPIDHRDPGAGTFQQRISILHRSEDRPTVFFTSGYQLYDQPHRSEPTQIVDGNQVSMEYRFFTPSRPEPADWDTLTIRQAAADQHRIHEALEGIYAGNWLATGGSKGGMTATYYRRFHPQDMDGTVAYVAPNNVNDRRDGAYDDFLATVGTEECRERLNAVQREALVRREPLVARYEEYAEANGYTFDLIGDADRAYEVAVLDLVFAFWQYQPASECAGVPADDASDDALWDFVDQVSGFAFYTDQGMTPYVPYFYQAGTQLGNPDLENAHLDGVLRYPGINAPRTFVPRDVPMEFDRHAMRDIDRWVRKRSSEMLFVYGGNDPWGAEPFRVGRHAGDSYVFTAPGANHGADIVDLTAGQRATATAAVLDWAGLGREAEDAARGTGRLTTPDPALDRQLARGPRL